MSSREKRIKCVQEMTHRFESVVNGLKDPETNGLRGALTDEECYNMLKNVHEVCTLIVTHCGRDMQLPMDAVRKATTSSFITTSVLQ